MWSKRKQEAARQWAALETTEFRRWVVTEVQRRSAAGERKVAKHVAFEVLEDVWCSTQFRRLANLAYKRTLALAVAAECHQAALVPLTPSAGMRPLRRRAEKPRHRAA